MSFKTRRTLFSFAIVLLALTGFVVMSFLLTKLISKQDEKKTSVATFEIAKKKKVQKQAKIKKKKRKKRRKVSAPQLSSRLTGNAFGLKSLEGMADFDASDLLGDLKDVVMTADTVDVVPKAKHQPSIDFPENARKSGIQGFVKVALLINSLGKVDNIKILQSEPSGYFDKIATNNVKNWLFEAAEYQGQKVTVWATTTIRFDMNGE